MRNHFITPPQRSGEAPVNEPAGHCHHTRRCGPQWSARGVNLGQLVIVGRAHQADERQAEGQRDDNDNDGRGSVHDCSLLMVRGLRAVVTLPTRGSAVTTNRWSISASLAVSLSI